MRDAPLPFLSIVVPTRNRARLLPDCVESLMRQDFPADRYEIIVVDDGSVDETPRVVADIQARSNDPVLRYVRQSVGGLNVARNAGLKVAEGDPILFVDDDVVAPPSWARAVAEGRLRHPGAGCFSGPVRLRLEGKAPRFCANDGLDGELNLGDVERPVEALIGANMTVRRGAIERIGMFNEALSGCGGGDETEWVLRLLETGGQVIYLPDAWVWHRRNAGDLRLWRILRKQFQRGREQVAFAKSVRQRMSLSQELGAIPRFIAHAVRRRCAGGLMSASIRAGRAWGLIRERT